MAEPYPSPAPDLQPPTPSVLVMGAGAVGGYFGGLLARAGVETTFVARGAHLEAIRGNGLRVRSPQGDFHVPARAVNDPREAAAADLVLFCVKSYHTEEAARALAPALGGTAAVLTLQNGVENEAALGTAVGERRVLPGVAYVSAAVEGPGVIRHMAEGSVAFGEPDGSASDRARAVEALFRRAGVKATLSDNIWGIKWAKLAWNATFNTLNALVGGTFDRIGTDEALLGVGERAMREIAAVAAAAGVRFPEQAVARGLAWARQAHPIKTSTLQDLEAGKRLELDALTGAVVRKAAALGVPVPTVAALHALLAARCRSYPPAPAGSGPHLPLPGIGTGYALVLRGPDPMPGFRPVLVNQTGSGGEEGQQVWTRGSASRCNCGWRLPLRRRSRTCWTCC